MTAHANCVAYHQLPFIVDQTTRGMATNHHIYIVFIAVMVTETMTAVCNVKYDILTRDEGCYTDMKSCAFAKGMPSLIRRCDRR